jgi:hypothetical protein
VLSEFDYANGAKKPTFRVVHKAFAPTGLNSNNEYAQFHAGMELNVVVKLMDTIAVWRLEHGTVARLRLEPDQLASQYDENQGLRVEPGVLLRWCQK